MNVRDSFESLKARALALQSSIVSERTHAPASEYLERLQVQIDRVVDAFSTTERDAARALHPLIYVVFDGQNPEARFVEVEDASGRSIHVGRIERPDGLWALEVPSGLAENKALRELLARGLTVHGATPSESVEKWYRWSEEVREVLERSPSR